MTKKADLWCKVASLILVLALLVPILAACGDDDEGVTVTVTETATATAGATSTTATSTTQPPLSQEPVKIAAINAWSGAAGVSGLYYADPVIEVVEKQVEEMGGILGGRPLEINKYDSQGNIAGATSAATKALIADKLSVVTLGGIGTVEAIAIADLACEEKAFFSSYVPLFDTPERECLVEATVTEEALIDATVTAVTEQLQPTPQTVAILTIEMTNTRKVNEGFKRGYESAGMETVYEEIVPQGTVDFSPYLTKIKYHNPDALILNLSNTAYYMGLAKQIMDLGGWGDIQVVADPVSLTAASWAGAKGWLAITPWYVEMDNPESRKFVQDFEAVAGKSPEPSHIYLYFSLWTAIHAIELAGTAEDGEAIAKAARSGELVFDTPMGPVHFNADGMGDVKMTTVRIEEGGRLSPLE